MWRALQQLQQPHDRIRVPRAPADPPALADVARAHIVKQDVYFSYNTVFFIIGGENELPATLADLGRAVVYEHMVTRAVAMGGNQVIAPAWFAPVQQLLNNMWQEVTHVQQGANNYVRLAELINVQNTDSQIFPFALVLFNDGTDPTQEPHNLPALTSIHAINRLTLEQCD
ncbi:hypothetical protein BS47DRAFT_1364782 [Hydnum rufescens UP504]|uniref:Mug135-like C-terminal domain-containing protein n=1 Tax=Hydnum rufescens UP504 TaxID=1448309 RepID=A0A9P6DQJ2_9AGAM|nr:hypothetical protein BS47DRAFT_1364782 [Hydnum rufescens UP504]